MPAVNADTLTLPRITRPEAGICRQVKTIIDALKTFEGEGFPVRRAFPGMDLRLADPFLLMDHMGAVEYAPGEAKGAPWHPHRGFETVTYMIDGTFRHRDSTGGGGLISNGDTQWMTAGAGILHEEMPPEDLITTGGLFQGVQLWVNLPRAAKWSPPRYQDITAGNIALLSSHDGGALVRLIAGDLGGHAGPGVTYTPITYAHATVSPGARLELPWRPDFNAMAYVLSGSGTAGQEGQPIREGQLAVFGSGDALALRADERQQSRSPGLEVLLLGGIPIGEPIVHYGPFVMNTREEILQAVEDYRAGRLGTIPAKYLEG